MFFASPFCKKLQNKNAENCNCILHKNAETITGILPMTFDRFVAGVPFCSAPVKGLSRHNGAPPPLFHGPLDRLAFLRAEIVPITGSQTKPGVSRSRTILYAGRPLHYISEQRRFYAGLCPCTPASSKEPEWQRAVLSR